MARFATVHITFWPIVFDDSPSTVDMEIIAETADEITCLKYPYDDETVTIRKNAGELIGIWEGERREP